MPKVNENGLLSGHMGKVVYRGVRDQQVVQSMPSQYHDANSVAQQKQRSGFSNIIALYRILKKVLQNQFEEAGRACDRFFHHNLLLPPVYIAKKDYDVGLCVPAPYIVSYGSLPSLDLEIHNGRLQFQMKAEEWQQGDILRLIKVVCKNQDGTIPTYLSCSYTETIINEKSNQLIATEPLPLGAYAYVHLRKTNNGTKVSTQRLLVIGRSQ